MNRLHAVMVPFPSQGSINPLINLAHLLSSRGVFITFVDTEWSHSRMSTAADESSASTFKFLTIPDGLPPDHGRLSEFAEYIIAMENLGPVLEHHLLCSLTDETPPITCIIASNWMSCTYEVANKVGVPRVIFWTMCAASSIAQCNANFLVSRGHIPSKVEDLKRADKVITCLPGNLPPLLPSDLFSFYRAADTSDVFYQWSLREAEIQKKADYVLVNTFDEVDAPEMVTALSINGCPALAVGPVFLPNLLEGRDLNGLASMSVQDESCLKWLDAQEPGSVIYVSFGSISVRSNEQLEELALGLEGSQHPFLWVLRMDSVGDKLATLPGGFVERTVDRGVIVKWAPQFLDCRFCKDVWKIGIDLEGADGDENVMVKREEIEKGVRRVMEGPKAEEMRKRGRELKEEAFKAVREEGSSFVNLNRFIHDITQLSETASVKAA
ncbi:hypothetical protein SUGI_0095220 [Cryptomeria japonica]|nr:hypothetical protein SUGI_0095220 [Cryptomeria japonica]